MGVWRASAARAGAFMVLRVTKTSYSDLNPGPPTSQRGGTDAELEAVGDEIVVEVSDLASFAPWDEYVLNG